EHVHFTFEGSYQLGLAWAEAAARMLPASVTNGAQLQWVDKKTCEQRLGLSDWNRHSVMESVLWRLHRPPMSTQSNNRESIAALQLEENELRNQMNASSAAVVRTNFADLLRRVPDDHYLYENFAEFLGSTGDQREELIQW